MRNCVTFRFESPSHRHELVDNLCDYLTGENRKEGTLWRSHWVSSEEFVEGLPGTGKVLRSLAFGTKIPEHSTGRMATIEVSPDKIVALDGPSDMLVGHLAAMLVARRSGSKVECTSVFGKVVDVFTPSTVLLDDLYRLYQKLRGYGGDPHAEFLNAAMLFDPSNVAETLNTLTSAS